MSQVTKDARVNSEGQTSDAEAVSFRSQSESCSVLDQLVREGPRRMLQTAIEAEVDEFLSLHAGRCDEAERRLVVRNGHLPSRAIATGAGRLEVTQPRVRDRSPDAESLVRFSSQNWPLYLRRSKSVVKLIPCLLGPRDRQRAQQASQERTNQSQG